MRSRVFAGVFALIFLLMLFREAAMADAPQYTYRAKIVDAYDGDTVTADIDLGFNTIRAGERLRLYGIDAPEVRGETRDEGLKSRDRLREWILGREVIIQTLHDKRGKYGRYLAIIFLDGENINDRLVAEGLAVKREY